MKAKDLMKDLVIVIVAITIASFIFLSTVLKDSYRYYPPTNDEIAQMGAFEKWIYEPFKEEHGE